MGIFGQRDDSFYEKDFFEEIKPELRVKNGNIHVLKVYTIKFSDKDEKLYNIQINNIIEGMKRANYEILDIKFDFIVAGVLRYETLIIYK